MPVEVVCEDVLSATLGQQLVADAVTALERACTTKVTLVLAGDLNKSVRDRLPPDYGRVFNADRVSGRVGAKVIPSVDGCAVVFDARLFVPSVAQGAGVDLARIVQHEALHLGVLGRSEDFESTFARIGPFKNARANFVALALQLVEEFRIERALCEEGFPAGDSHATSIDGMLSEFAAAVLDGVTLRFKDEDITRCSETVLPAFGSLATHLAYMAGHEVAQGEDQFAATPPSAERWERYVGDNFRKLIDLLRPIPSATKPYRVTAGAASELADMLEDWLAHIGFELYDLDSGDMYFNVLRHDFP